MDFSAALDHVGPELRLDRFREVDPGDEEFVVVGDDGETEPVADAVHDGFAAVEGDLELVAAVVEDDAFARGIDVAEEPVEFRDVIDAEVIAGAHFDDVPVLVRSRGRLRSGCRGGFGRRFGG